MLPALPLRGTGAYELLNGCRRRRQHTVKPFPLEVRNFKALFCNLLQIVVRHNHAVGDVRQVRNQPAEQRSGGARAEKLGDD